MGLAFSKAYSSAVNKAVVDKSEVKNMYNPHNWVSEEIITADKLNHIETGVQDTEKKIDAVSTIKGDKGDNAVINVVTQAQYDALADKTGLYVIQG